MSIVFVGLSNLLAVLADNGNFDLCKDAGSVTICATNSASVYVNIALYLIPASLGFFTLHKLMDHQTNVAGFFTELLLKGGGSLVVLLLIKNIAGV